MPKIADIERTPNPDAMRFVLREPITHGVTKAYDDASQVPDNDEFAKALFNIPHVISLYYVERYVTVTQDGTVDWSELLRQLAPPIREAKAQVDLMQDNTVHITDEAKNSDDPRFARINEMLDEQVRPYLLADGGGLQILSFHDNVLKVHYQGSCGTCPSSTTGTLFAIESMIKRIDPEIMIESV